MRYTKTTAVLLAVSMFLAGCGGSTGIAASGAGMTAFMVPGTIEDYAFKRDVLAIFKTADTYGSLYPFPGFSVKFS